MTLSEIEQAKLKKACNVTELVRGQITIIGLWPFKITLLSNMRFALFVIYHACFLLSIYVDLVIVFGDVVKTVENLCEVGIQSIIFFRAILFKINKKIHNLYATTIEDMNIDNYIDDEEKKLFIKYHYFNYQYLKVGGTTFLVSCTMYHLKAVPLYIAARLNNETMILPPPYRTNPVFFDITPLHRIIILYIAEAPIIYIASLLISMTSMYGSIVLNICTQLAVHAYRMRNRFIENKNKQTVKTEVFFREHVDTYCKLISMVRETNELYYVQLIIELVYFTLLLALLIYSMTQAVAYRDIRGIMFITLYSACILIVIYIMCYLGQSIQDAVVSPLNTIIYNNNYY